MPLIVPRSRIEHTNHRLFPSEKSVGPFKTRPTSTYNPKAFHDMNKPLLRGLSLGSESGSSFEAGERSACADDVREESPSLSPGANGKSRAIPIPHKFCESKIGDEDDVSEQAKYRYNLATWNMYERIVQYRQRNPMSGAYSQEDITLAKENKHPHDKESEPGSYNPDVNYYDMEEGIFDMEM